MARLATLIAAVALVLTGCGGGPDDDPAGSGLGATRMDVPRPTSGRSAACDSDPLPPSTNETTEQRVAALRSVGLFADRAGVSDAALAAEIDTAIQSRWGEPDAEGVIAPLPPDDPFMDLFVANEDASRVWWNDLESDVGDGNDVYVDALGGWAAISKGAFAPTGIEETWDGEKGPITVTFEEGGARRTLRPAYLEDWIDPGILVPIDDLIAGSGRRFELYKDFDQTAFVMALTDAERTALEARGWCFE